ncbi:hypothetical protein NPRO_14470 [Candidatus Nitrosymbiomonas proteolyticus]|uniref:Uncharacterized protein n=1 Tax=Candidatus Nitrosymbiomonas proteolyticus TaxID=2608984 RepID=A0A809RVJ6_9BACT|nr:hypothetical protein NPRO_14470 [Candidatus Nitrosymbiomonas proteolyticus]
MRPEGPGFNPTDTVHRTTTKGMDVILDAARLDRGAADVGEDADDIGMQFLPDRRCDPRGSVLRAENGVDQDGGEGLRHPPDCIAAFQAAGHSGARAFQGVALRW